MGPYNREMRVSESEEEDMMLKAELRDREGEKEREFEDLCWYL